MSRPRGYVSCDVDTIDRHLQGYGFPDEAPDDIVYRKAVPRVLDLLDELGLRCTFFIVARDAVAQSGLLRDMVARGHEVASHSWHHEQPFSRLDDTELTYELAASRRVLGRITGEECVGFRAPAWDVDDRVLGAIALAGYRYDASLFPTPLLWLSRLTVAARSRSARDVLSMNVLRHAFARAVPHSITTGGGLLLEVPATISPLSRLPYYHTFGYMVPRPLFRAIFADVRRSGIPVSYEFHAADLLDFRGDGVDPRMSRHPGMMLAYDQKRAFLRDILGNLRDGYDLTVLRDAAPLM
jgi:peptidoglycan-N-acetylglucosamine deacetylase